jgi:hypothetical protein
MGTASERGEARAKCSDSQAPGVQLGFDGCALSVAARGGKLAEKAFDLGASVAKAFPEPERRGGDVLARIVAGADSASPERAASASPSFALGIKRSNMALAPSSPPEAIEEWRTIPS